MQAQPWLWQQSPKAHVLERGPSWKCCEGKPGRRPFSRRHPWPSSAKYQGARAGKAGQGLAASHAGSPGMLSPELAASSYTACFRAAGRASCLPPCFTPSTRCPSCGPSSISLAHGRHSACTPLERAVLGCRGVHCPSHIDPAPGNLPTQPAVGSSAHFIPAPYPAPEYGNCRAC